MPGKSQKVSRKSQYLIKELNYEVDDLHTDKHERHLQVYSIIFDGFGQASPNYPGKFANLCDILRKKSGMKLGT